ncbi:Acbp2 [Scenedesmus sp. PABB004]|nr:Acbp2 [Scenedesmus sp. PABB004]
MVSAAHWHRMGGAPIVVTENVVEYRRAVPEFVTRDDVVLEVGCAEGLTTAALAKRAKLAIGVDKSPGQIAKAVARHGGALPNLAFACLDAFDLAAVRQRVGAAGGARVDVVFLDVSGSRAVGDVAALLGKYERVFAPRVFVVKAFHLKRLEDFDAAAERIKPVSGPNNDEMLEMYALFKQANVGDNTTARPGLLDIKGRKKWDAWTSKKGAAPAAPARARSGAARGAAAALPAAARAPADAARAPPAPQA